MSRMNYRHLASFGRYLWLRPSTRASSTCVYSFSGCGRAAHASILPNNTQQRDKILKWSSLSKRYCSISDLDFENVSDETLESLTEFLEALVELDCAPQESDVSFSSGVLTLQLGSHGTYVINKQTPNKQIWLSSPTSGPKRYDFTDNTWIYKHDGVAMHTLLMQELSEIFNEEIDLTNCAYSVVE
ncbi:Frataxin [Trinorchestia longiramus]|nr:Frataxin [Trinorchestia longiramus]